MKFVLKFASQERNSHIYDLPYKEIGLKGVEAIRRKTGVPELVLEVIEGEIKGTWNSEKSIEISERLATESQRFVSKNIVEVKVAPKFLNRFFNIEEFSKACRDTG